MSRKGFCWSVLAVLIGWAALVVPASAQHFQQVKGALAHVAAGRNEVFGVDATARVYRANATKTAFVRLVGPSLVQVAVGGGTSSGSQLDDVWGLDENQNMYHFDYKTKAFVATGGLLTQIVVGEGVEDKCHPYETWGINSSEQVFRYDYCAAQMLPITSPALTQIATGGGDVWGLDASGGVWHYDFSKGAFINPIFAHFSQITVGVNDVWGVGLAVDGSPVLRYDPNNGDLFSVTGLKNPLSQIAAGGDGVWAIDSSSNIFRYDPSSNSFVQIIGSLSNISVGSGAGVFGVNAIDEVFMFVRP